MPVMHSQFYNTPSNYVSNVAAWQACPLEALTEGTYHASIFHLSCISAAMSGSLLFLKSSQITQQSCCCNAKRLCLDHSVLPQINRYNSLNISFRGWRSSETAVRRAFNKMCDF